MLPAKPPYPKKEPGAKRSFPFFYLLLALWMAFLVRDLVTYGGAVETITYSQFLDHVEQDRLSEVAVGTRHVEGAIKQPNQPEKRFRAERVEDPDLVDRLREKKIPFSALRENTFLTDMLSWVFPVLLIMGFWWFLLRRMGGNIQGDMLGVGKAKARIYVEKGVQTRFADVAGVDEAKAELQEVVQFLKDPVQYSRLGGHMPKGLLLVGPPGTGKTMMARAVAGEAVVPFYSINGSEFVEMFVGLGAARVRDLFQQARQNAPCIIFIDELDALGKARGINAVTGGANDEKEQTLNQMLAELDGFDPAIGVVLLAATNRPEILDPALLRSGRFDRQILIDKPDRKGREQILRVHFSKIQSDPGVSLDVIASMTAGFSGADLANLVNEAALVATRRNASNVEQRDFTEAIERMVAGLERRSRILSADEKNRVAFHEMGHAVTALALGQGETVHKVTVIPRGLGALGYTFQRATEDRYLVSRRELESKIASLLGGRASEQLFLDDISTGAADDLDKATEIARAMVTRFGMSEKLGNAVFEKGSAPVLGSLGGFKAVEYSELTSQRIDAEVKAILDRAMTLAQETLQKYMGIVKKGAGELVIKESLDEKEVKELWNSREGVSAPRIPEG